MSTGKQIESVAVPIRSIYSDSRNRYGLVIPEYQRNYAWESDQINRFYFDIINGLSLRRYNNG